MTVKLETCSGTFVTWAVLLPFKVVPDVVTWGTRIFVYDRALTINESSARIPTYREALVTNALNTNAIGGLASEHSFEEVVRGVEKHSIEAAPRELDEREAVAS